MKHIILLLISTLSISAKSILRAEKNGWSTLQTHHVESVDPEADMSFCEIVRYHGYQCELNTVKTKDGFLLGLFRIPGRENSTKQAGYPVLLQHGLLACSDVWVFNPHREQNLAFVLSDLGYDVYLGNSRGNTYSQNHTTLKPDQEEFWAWSWDEMAQYDLPACIDYILSGTGYKTLYYVGHSQGTLMAFTHLSQTYTEKISHFIALAPIFYVKHMKSPIRLIAPIAHDVKFLFDLFGVQDFLPNKKLTDELSEIVCNKEDPLDPLCYNIGFLIAGFDKVYLNTSRVPVYIGHIPAGTSTQNMVHFAQMVQTGNCSRFDFGSSEANMNHYHQKTPPVYNLTNINSTKISLFWAENDWLADPTDVAYIRDTLKAQSVVTDDIFIPQWNHYDFNIATNIYPAMISKIAKIFSRKSYN